MVYPDLQHDQKKIIFDSERKQKFNRAYGRVDHVFQGRYKAILVEKYACLWGLARYIVLSPVRAGMIHHASVSRIIRAEQANFKA